MAKRKKGKKSGKTLDNLQMKPLVIAFFAGMFLGIQASNTGTMAMFAFGAIAGVSLSAAAYLLLDLKNRGKEDRQ